MRSARPLLLIAPLALALAAREGTAPAPTEGDAAEADTLRADALAESAVPLDTVDVQGVSVARARVQAAAEGTATGVVTLSRVSGGVRVLAEVQGLTPEAFHALQILSGRDCQADPAEHLRAAADTSHGGPYSLPGLRHAGDLGSIRGEGDGAGRYDRIDAVLSLDGTTSPVGRALVIRALRDDAASPDGAAGEVIGCGVIERVR